MNCKTQIIETSTCGRCDRVLRNSPILGGEWLSRSVWEWLFREKRIRSLGKVLRPGDTVSAGATVEIAFPGDVVGLLPARDSASLVARGDDWLFVNKPAGVPTLPRLPWDCSCFANQVTTLVGEKGLLTAIDFSFLAEPPILEGGLVQRLDNETSGGILVALTSERKAALRTQISEGRINKTYLAVTRGVPEEGMLIVWLDEEVPGKKMRASPSAVAESKRAELRIEIVSSHGGFSLLRIATADGMRHVVRVALASLGSPICGDTLYGGGMPATVAYPFHLLHAETVTPIELPQLRAPLPLGFIQSLKELKLEAR